MSLRQPTWKFCSGSSRTVTVGVQTRYKKGYTQPDLVYKYYINKLFVNGMTFKHIALHLINLCCFPLFHLKRKWHHLYLNFAGCTACFKRGLAVIGLKNVRGSMIQFRTPHPDTSILSKIKNPVPKTDESYWKPH